MTDLEWLKKNTAGCIEQIKQRQNISVEQQGLLNVLYGTLGLIDDMEYLLSKTGHWTTHRTNQHDGEWYCDRCDYEPTVFEATPYCPNCGASMEVDK